MVEIWQFLANYFQKKFLWACFWAVFFSTKGQKLTTQKRGLLILVVGALPILAIQIAELLLMHC
jgi:hypothetical protein